MWELNPKVSLHLWRMLNEATKTMVPVAPAQSSGSGDAQQKYLWHVGSLFSGSGIALVVGQYIVDVWKKIAGVDVEIQCVFQVEKDEITLHWPLGSQLVSYVETREDDDGPAQRIPTSDEAEAPEAVGCNICRRLLNGPRQYRDHVAGKHHRNNQRMGRCFRAWKGAGSIPSPDDALGEGEDRAAARAGSEG